MRKQINRRKHCLGSTRRYHALLRLHDQSFQIAKLVFSWKAPSLTLIMIAMKILVVVATPLKFHMFLRWVPHPSHDSFVLRVGGSAYPHKYAVIHNNISSHTQQSPQPTVLASEVEFSLSLNG